jgi:hypothetical protein
LDFAHPFHHRGCVIWEKGEGFRVIHGGSDE